jgi:hypothetical protein
MIILYFLLILKLLCIEYFIPQTSLSSGCKLVFKDEFECLDFDSVFQSISDSPVEFHLITVSNNISLCTSGDCFNITIQCLTDVYVAICLEQDSHIYSSYYLTLKDIYFNISIYDGSHFFIESVGNLDISNVSFIFPDYDNYFNIEYSLIYVTNPQSLSISFLAISNINYSGDYSIIYFGDPQCSVIANYIDIDYCVELAEINNNKVQETDCAPTNCEELGYNANVFGVKCDNAVTSSSTYPVSDAPCEWDLTEEYCSSSVNLCEEIMDEDDCPSASISEIENSPCV